jgi:hypothetical protein
MGPSILAKIKPTNVVTFSKTQPHYATKRLIRNSTPSGAASVLSI